MSGHEYDTRLAIIGIACRVPGARNSQQFWENVCAGRDEITDFPDALEGCVRSRGIVEDAECFDASFFGYTPREAALTDPQHRLFLESAWHALEDAGIGDIAAGKRVGVFASCGLNTYLLNNLAQDRELMRDVDYHQLMVASDKDYLATRVSYKLDLRGPSVSIATACSSSLVAIHEAAQSILNGECEIAIAGGVSVPVPLRDGFHAKGGGVLAPNGRCRAFGADAEGIVGGSGVAIVVLARLHDAVAAGQRPYAVLRGSAINNDGAIKTGFTAPSIQGQSAVIAEALAVAGVDPATIGYVEAHGTGTKLGDPIEIAALTRTYREAGALESRYCAIGSVKSNIGHLDAAAGAIGFIKAALAIHHQTLPPTLHAQETNPEIDFANSPFFVNTALREWRSPSRRAAVSAFGLGGTNAHAILEEFTQTRVPSEHAPAYVVLAVSAKSDCGLERAIEQLEAHLEAHPELPLADVAFTLAQRRMFDRRRAIVRRVHAPGQNGAASDAMRSFETLGAAWVDGAPLDAAAYGGAAGRRIVSLPGYPFEPQRHWIEASNATTTEAPVTVDKPSGFALPSVKEIVARVAGIAPEAIADRDNVFDLGLDSLAMMQVNQGIKERFGVTLALSDLLMDLAVVGDLAQRIEDERPAPPVAKAAEPEAQVATEEPMSSRDAIIAQQLEIMRMQLEVLGAAPTAAHALPTSALPSDGAAPNAKKPLAFSARPEAASHALSAAAQEHVRAFTLRYNARTRRSKEYAARYRDVLADSRAAVGFRPAFKELLYPIVGQSAKGSRIWDIDGNEYIDVTNGFGVTLFGHRPPFIEAAVHEHLHELFMLGPRSPFAGEAAQLVAELTGLPRVTFTNSGTEAVMAAIRLARARTGRERIVMFEGSYHGHSDQTLAQSTWRGGTLVTEGIAPGISIEAVGSTSVLEYGSEAALEYIRAHGHEIAAVLVEPVQNMRLEAVPPVEFLRELRALTAQSGSALIFDEMITGFRLHPAGARGYFGVEADIATYGKIAGGGMPIGVVAGTPEFLDGIDGGTWRYGDESFPAASRTFFGGTFCQHPLSMIAAVAALRELKARGPKLQIDLNARTTAFAQRLNAYFDREALPMHVAHFGSAFRISVPSALDLLWYHLIERGVYVWEWRGCFLSTAHTDDDLDRVVHAIEESIGELRDAGVASPRTAPASAPVEQTEETFALTPAQRQLWALARLHPNGALAYKMGFGLLLRGELDVARLEQAIATLVARHDALRTRFEPDALAQRVTHEPAAPPEFVDFSQYGQRERQDRIDRWFSEKNARPMELDRGPLFTVAVLREESRRHVLVVSVHHAISDGWSVANLVSELAALYEGRALEPVPMQFREYAAWQSTFLRGDECKRQEAYWLAELAESPAQLALPYDRPRHGERTYRAARETLVLAAEETRAIKQFAARERCTLFIALYAAYGALLQRWTQATDLVVGLSASGRGCAGSDGLVGYCTHVLPVRLEIDAQASFAEHLAVVKKKLASAYEHQDYPFASLLERLQNGRDKSQVPLVSATFNLDKPTKLPAMGSVELDAFSHPVHFSDIELMVNVIDLGDRLVIDCDYSTDLFDAETIARYLESYRLLVAGAFADPHQRIAHLPVQSEEELEALADSETPQSDLECVHETIARRAAEQPDAIAIVCEQRQLTYAELDARANRIAHRLVADGVNGGDLVGVRLEPSIDLVAALLGVLKAGGAYVPIDPTYPEQRIAMLLEDAQPKVVITEETLADLDRYPQTAPPVSVGLDALAYVIYTSGSTGKPKGVLVQHDNLAQLFVAARRDFAFDASDVWTLFHSFTFDFSVWEIFGALVHGARLVVVPYWLARDPSRFLNLVREAGVTVLNQTPSAFRQFIAADEASDAREALPLRYVIFGGEALEPSMLRPWFERHGDVAPKLVNMYGITETTVHVTYRLLDAAFASGHASRIGKPLAGVSAYVLDRWMQPLPRGVAGELYVGGAGVARGYLNQDALTRERFVRNPFGAGRLYRSGDLARITNDGELEYLGRGDEQVKVRGFRIELGEIEAVLRAHPAVRDAIVMRCDAPSGAPYLAAYVVSTTTQIVAAELREFVASRLPEYMVPSAYLAIDAIPLTRNGKIDRAALPDPMASSLGDAPEAAPRDAIEEQLSRIWAEVLGRDRVGIFENFFELGGDSIVGMQVSARAAAAGIPITLRDLHLHPTVAALARIAASGHRQNTSVASGDGEALLPIQRWFLESAQPHPERHQMTLVLEVEPSVDAAQLGRAFDAVIAHHDALRAGFTQAGATWKPTVERVVPPVSVQTIDVRGASGDERNLTIARVGNELASAMRMEAPPLLRAALFDAGAMSWRLLIAVHHLAIDGVSWRILLDDLQSAYAQLARGTQPALPPVTLPPQAWAAAIDRAVGEGRFAGDVAAWRAQSTGGVVRPDFDAPDSANTVAAQAILSLELDAVQTAAFLASSSHARPDELLLAAFATGARNDRTSDALVIDLETHGREPLDGETVDLSRSIGWFTAFYPVRIEIREGDDARALLRAVQAARERAPERKLGYLALRAHGEALAGAPAASVLFNYLGQFHMRSPGGFVRGVASEPGGDEAHPENRRSHAIEINAFIVDDRLRIDVAYATAQYARERIERIGGEMLCALSELTRGPAPPASYGQERLWFLQQFEGASNAYHAQGAIRLEGEVRVDVLRRAIDEIVRRHDVLRTTFHLESGGLVQLVGIPWQVPIPEIDLRGAGDEAVRAWIEEENQRPFDLERGPLMRVALVRLREDEAILALTIHHIVTDGWSRGIFFKELTQLYAAYCREEPSPLAPLPMQYADYARSQRRAMNTPAWNAHVEYWKRALSEAPALSTIPSDDARAEDVPWRGDVAARRLSPEVVTAANALGRSRGATTYMVLLAALQVLVARWSGASDIVIGTPSVNRDRAELQQLIGFFINALPLRANVSRGLPFVALLERVRDVALGAFEHQEMPFERIVEELAPPRDPNYNPIFQIFFNMQNLPEAALDLAGLRVSDYPIDEVRNRFDITLYAFPDSGGMRLELVYNASLFRRERIDVFLAHYERLLREIASDPSADVYAYSLEEPEALPPLEPVDNGAIFDRFLQSAQRSPDAVAVTDAEVSWTYGELALLSGRIAHSLLKQGCAPGDLIAIELPAGAALVAAMIGVMRAGCMACAIDPSTPRDRVAAIYEQCRPRLSLNNPTAVTTFLNKGQNGAHVGEHAVGADSLAYVAFTSGTTGAPLGVIGTHGPVSHFVAWHAERFALRAGDRFALLAGVAHDPLLRDIFVPLSLGATLHIPPIESKEQSGVLARWLAQERITVAHLTPALGTLIAAEDTGVVLGELRYAFFGGDRLSYGDVRALSRVAPDCITVNCYGTTETPQVMSYHVAAADEAAASPAQSIVPIGTAIEGVQVLVRNGEGECAAYERGEICVRTPYLTRGYLDPHAAPQRFGEIAGVSAYRTGDLGYRRPDGVVVLTGRNDDQLKVRGFRIEPREIEAAFEAHPAITRAHVLTRRSRDEVELAVFVAGEVSALDPRDVRAFALDRLPRPLVPAQIVVLATLPLTRNGKIDRDALRAKLEQTVTGDGCSELDGPVETALGAIWQEVLGCASVGPNDDFFALGGHSLKAVRVTSRIERDLGARVALRTLFRYPRLRDLARAIVADATTSGERIEALAPALEYEASHAQRRLWSLSRLGNSAVYNMTRALMLDGPLDRNALEHAFATIVARHDMLRTVFVMRDGALKQRVIDDVALPLAFADLRGEHDPLEAARDAVQREAMVEFALEDTPAVRMSLLQVANDAHVLVFNIHHILADAWSLAVLIREFAAAYDGAHRSVNVAHAELRIGYKEYAAWQMQRLEGSSGARLRDFWHAAMAAPLPVLELPADRPRPRVRSGEGARVALHFDAELGGALRKLAREHGSSLYMLLLALVKTLLFRLSGTSDLIVGAPVAGRNHVDLENQVGLYVNMLPLRSRLDAEQPFAELLESVARTTTAAFEHQEYPFDRLVAELSLARDVTRTPLFDVVVVLQNAEIPEFKLNDLQIAPFDTPAATSKFDLNFTFEERGDCIEGFLEFTTDLFTRERAERTAAQLEVLARSGVTDAQQPIRALNLLPPHERALVQQRWNATDAGYPQATLVELFEEQVRSSPEATAVIFEDRELTYAQLDAHANAIGAALRREANVQRGDIVAVIMERSELLPAALLGVLKAGAAYLPIDPAYPRERIGFTLEDAGCATLLADAANAHAWRGAFQGTMLDVERIGPQDERLPLRCAADDSAYVIYTSGSTGRPKGCLVTHRNVVRLLKNDAFPFAFGCSDTWSMLHSAAFDFSVWEMYGALLSGGTLAIAGREIVRDPGALRAFLRRHRVSVLSQTPSAFDAIVGLEATSPVHDLDEHLRYVIFGGDRLVLSHLQEWIRFYPTSRIKLINMYGITETTVHVTFGPLSDEQIRAESASSPIGVPLPQTRVYVCDPYMNVQPIGVPGEMYIGGSGVCNGYLHRPELNAERFIPSPFHAGERLYRSGDIGVWRADGTLEYLGRNDRQVQVRGYRVELGEIRHALERHPAVREAVIDTWESGIVAWFVRAQDALAVSESHLRAHLATTLPDHMLPTHLIEVDSIPLTVNGKVDLARMALPRQAAPSPPTLGCAEGIAQIWREVLQRESVGYDESFFELGGHSLMLIEVHRRLVALHAQEIPLVELYRYPTIRALAEFLEGKQRPAMEPPERARDLAGGEIAVIGIAGRFPGANDIDAFWKNLCDGIESSVTLSDDDLRAAGVPEHLIADARYVRNKPVLDGVEEFDADFFGIAAREAEIMDPQHRLFLECAWRALEDAAYDAARYQGRVGVYSAVSINSYLFSNLLGNQGLIDRIGMYPMLIANDRDFLATRTSYKLNLKGPAMVVGAACSGSMVAVHSAILALRSGECDMALAGGASVKVPQHEGYLYDEGGILSPDGHCRAFDASANGTVSGSGVGIVVLKRMEDAVRDGDHVYAVIRGIAAGNDGSEKVGYTAPSVTGQADVIARAQAQAGVDPGTITYVEAHGTGTSVGDPIEVAALVQAFGSGDGERTCALGSVKTNIGHLDAAAGVAGLIKTALSLEHKTLPPSLNFERANERIDFSAGPFYVNTTHRSWESQGSPRRAGVSSFGLGGTNVHAVLEEAPLREQRSSLRRRHLVQLSAPSARALEHLASDLGDALASRPDVELADVAFTLAQGRRAFAHRRAVLACDVAEAARLLRDREGQAIASGIAAHERKVAFLFPGGGAQYVAMGRDLYETEPAFRAAIDRCNARDALLHADANALRRPTVGLPALFAVEYALAKTLAASGVLPSACIGHSLGEYAAATIAGVFDLDDALELVALRGRLFEQVAPGAMLAVAAAPDRFERLMDPTLSIAAINLPESCVLSGPIEGIERSARALEAEGIDCRRLHIDVAAHSSLIDPIVPEFGAFLRTIQMRAPQVPFVSNLSGTWITSSEACDPEYWCAQLRSTVRFADGVAQLVRDPETVLLEIGPGNTLSSFAARHPQRSEGQAVLRAMRRPDEKRGSDDGFLQMTLGRLWSHGVVCDPSACYASERRTRVSLPGLRLERKRFWIDPVASAPLRDAYEKRSDIQQWFYASAPTRSVVRRADIAATRWLLVGDEGGVGAALAERLRLRGHDVELVDAFDGSATALSNRIVFVAALDGSRRLSEFLALVQACVKADPQNAIDLSIVTTAACDVGGEMLHDARDAAFAGIALVVPQEHGHIKCRLIDIVATDAQTAAAQLEGELYAAEPERVVAYRFGHRWTYRYHHVSLDAQETRLREGGVYLITGGTGGVGAILARYLAREYRANMVLLARQERASDRALCAQVAQLGGKAMVLAGDVGAVPDVQAAITLAEENYGCLHGIIHAAGVTSGDSIFAPSEALNEAAFAEQLHPKLGGALALAQALDGRAIDFVLTISSNAAALGGLGLAAYAGASAAMDRFVAAQTSSATPWITARFDGWPTQRRESTPSSQQTSLDRLSMTLEESEAVFRRVLAAPPGDVVVSSADWDARVARFTSYETAIDGPVESADGSESPVDDGIGDPLERTIAGLWREMLGVERFGVHDNFFDLRGDSLLGSRMITRLGVKLGRRIPLRTLFEAPTVASLAARIASLEGLETSPLQSAPIPRLPDAATYPLSHAQRRLWVLAQMDGGSRAYHVALALRLRGELDRDALRRALETIGERHESLRTTFIQTPEGPAQCVRERAPWSLAFSDVTDAQDPQAAAFDSACALRDEPIDLGGALVRTHLVRVSANEHVLALVLHHIVADGWSLSVLAREIGTLYDAYRRGEASPLPPLRVQYRDAAAWLSHGEEHDRAYWTQRLAALPALDLPTDFARPPVRAFQGAIVSFAFDAQERRGLERLAHEHGTTLFMVLCAIVNVLLARHTGSRDIALGTPVAGRHHPDLDEQIGFYLNTVVLRNELVPGTTFAAFLAQVRETALDAYAHDAYPFDELAQALDAARDPSRSPLVDVQVSMQNAGSLELRMSEVEVTPLPLDTGESKCDVTFDFTDASNLEGGIRYDSALFERATIERMADHLRALARSAAADPLSPCDELAMFGQTEREALIEAMSGPALDLPDATMLDHFAAWVASAPERLAVQFEESRLTYRQLDERANRIANALLASGLQPGDVAGVRLERSHDLLAALLGVLKAGLTYVPIDPLYPAVRIAQMLERSGAAYVLDALTDLDLEAASAAAPEVEIDPNALAYILFTSGSTGIPKGVEITHRNLLNFLLSMQLRPGITEHDVLLAVTTVSFDIAGLELYLPLISGACVAIVSAEDARDGDALALRLRAGDITMMQATPSTWSMLLACGWEGGPKLRVLCGGEALSGALASALLPRCGELWNLYGPTETTIWSSVCRVAAEEATAATVSLGRPIHNTRFAVLDANMQPVPTGVAGELYIGGSGVARGYRADPALTAERFVPDPFGAAGDRLYRSGDVVRMLPNGTFVYLGRTDHQVKIRGHRIELGEIEAALLRDPAITECVVAAVSDARGERAICAYIVASEAREHAAVRAHLERTLPAYMVPAHVMQLDALPLAANGKVNRAALPAPREPARAVVQAPRTELERALARIWEEVLELEGLGIEDDFFAIGGESLKATRVVFRAQTELGVTIALIDVFRNPTIASLARTLAERECVPELVSAHD